MKNKTRNRVKNIFVLLLTLCGIVGILVYPEVSCDSAEQAIEMCLTVLVPTLFPFLVLSGIFIKCGFAERLGRLLDRFTKKVFCVGGNCSSAMILGLVSGFPVGAKTVSSLYKNGACSKVEAERTLAFCNNAGPSFILGTVGVGIWQSGKTGWLLWAVQIVSAVFVGIIVGRIWKGTADTVVFVNTKNNIPQKQSVLHIFLSSVTDGAVSMLYICSFVVFFAVAVSLLLHTGLIPSVSAAICKLFPFFERETVENLLVGIFEMTTGVSRVGNSAPVLQNLAVTSALIGWAGISVHCQVLSYICDGGLSPKPYFIGKILQTAFATALIFICSFLIPSYKADILPSSEIPQISVYALVCGAVVAFSLTVLFLLFRSKKQTEKTVKFSRKP